VLKNLKRKSAFTIIELLTVMSVIIILIGLLVPALNMVRRVARNVTQDNQFHAIEVALDLFHTEYERYPPSSGMDQGVYTDYCGAMQLCEAMMGQDLLGFHPGSRFRGDGQINDDTTTQLYPAEGSIPPEDYRMNLLARRGPYLPTSNANARRIRDLYQPAHMDLGDAYANPNPDRFVLCDVYPRNSRVSTTAGMVGTPVLYYRAETSHTGHGVAASIQGNGIYDYRDNHRLVGMGVLSDRAPSAGGPEHDLYTDIGSFYTMTQDNQITTAVRPVRADSYILLSAGPDGIYGTPDDRFNFGRH
jgi:type II secretory pathway pseudopilin PulG